MQMGSVPLKGFYGYHKSEVKLVVVFKLESIPVTHLDPVHLIQILHYTQ